MVLSTGTKKDHVVKLAISEINISKIVRLAGEMIDCQTLATLNGGEDSLVFRDVLIYFSTGAMILGRHYERGIHVKGNLEFFGKKGEFDGRFNDDGVLITGGIDNFNIGGLEVRSARAQGKRATMDIEMTDRKQKIFVDGLIRYCALELKVMIDADLQERHLEADISLKFTESIALLLKAKAVVGTGSNPLDELKASFRAELRPDVVKVIFDAIDQVIEAIGKMATEEIEHIQQSLQSQVNEKEAELQEVKKELNRQQQISQQELKKRQIAIDGDNKKRAELETELDNLREAVTKAQTANNQNQAEIEALKREEEATKRKFNEKIRQTEDKYRKRELEERRKQDELENKIERLKAQKEASFGDKLRSQAEADRSWKWWLSKFELFNANSNNFGSMLNV